MERMKKLRGEIYYCEGDPKNPESHKGFVGEAYCRAAKFYEKNVDMFEKIANKELPRLNNEQDYDYEIDIYDDIYAVKFSYFYASECSYIYKRAFEKFFEEKGGPEKAEEYIRKNGLKIISVGAGNLVDYWGLEAALFLLNFSDDVISNIQYEAYEYKEWGSEGVNKTSSDGISRMMNCENDIKDIYKIKNKKFHIGPEDGNIFNAKNGNADIIFFPNSFNELQKQRPDEFSELLKNLKSNNNDTIVAITYHTGEKDGSDSIEKIFKEMDFVNAEKIDDKNTKSIIDDQGMKKSCKNYFLENNEGRSVFYNKQQDERNKKANYSILEDEKVENTYLSNCANKGNGGCPTFYGDNDAGRYNIMKENDNLNYVIYKMSAK